MGTEMILKVLVVGPFATNCYVVGSEPAKQGMIIDPAAEAKAILDAVHQLGISISLIVVTHTHIDHIGAVREIKRETNADFALHEAEGRGIAQVISRLPQPDRLLKDGDTIDIGDLHFLVLHTPGHSPGGISLLGHGVVFCGDTLFKLGIGRTDLPGCSHNQLISSIQSKLMVLPDETIVLPGHGPWTTIGDERRMNSFLLG